MKLRKGGGAPTFCWMCGKQLQRAPGRGLFYFNLVRDPDAREHRVHGDCTQPAVDAGNRLVTVGLGAR
jgi:hypothetical protein